MPESRTQENPHSFGKDWWKYALGFGVAVVVINLVGGSSEDAAQALKASGETPESLKLVLKQMETMQAENAALKAQLTEMQTKLDKITAVQERGGSPWHNLSNHHGGHGRFGDEYMGGEPRGKRIFAVDPYTGRPRLVAIYDPQGRPIWMEQHQPHFYGRGAPAYGYGHRYGYIPHGPYSGQDWSGAYHGRGRLPYEYYHRGGPRIAGYGDFGGRPRFYHPYGGPRGGGGILQVGYHGRNFAIGGTVRL